MTPKEKVEEIYKRMLFWLDESNTGTVDIISVSSIKCALIAVDEIINSYDALNQFSDSKWYHNGLFLKYWEKMTFSQPLKKVGLSRQNSKKR